ncbi:TPA: pheST operon leader peptide PheM [Klebsiella pneumoniae]|nr:pheST operon leader peptide PheM [Escherichia coli]
MNAAIFRFFFYFIT